MIELLTNKFQLSAPILKIVKESALIFEKYTVEYVGWETGEFTVLTYHKASNSDTFLLRELGWSDKSSDQRSWRLKQIKFHADPAKNLWLSRNTE